MARFIANLMAWGILFLSLSTIAEVTYWLATQAGESHKVGLVSLTRLNHLLMDSRPAEDK